VSWPRKRRGSSRHRRGREARIDPHDSPQAVLAHDLDFPRGHEPGCRDVDQATVEDVLAQQDLVRPADRTGARLSFVVDVVTASGPNCLDASDRHEQLTAADPRLEPHDRRESTDPSRRTTTSSTRPSRSPAESSSWTARTDETWITSGISRRSRERLARAVADHPSGPRILRPARPRCARCQRDAGDRDTRRHLRRSTAARSSRPPTDVRLAQGNPDHRGGRSAPRPSRQGGRKAPLPR